MSRKLAFISVISLVLCGVFLGLARMIGGDAIFHDPHSLEGIRPLIDMATHKEWRWAGGDTLAIESPMHLRYQPEGAPNIAVTGSDEAMKHVHFRKGRIESDAASPKGLKAVVSGVTIRKFVVNSDESLELGHVDQSDLEIHLNGSGSVHGDGKVGRLKLVVAGNGTADLGKLSVGDADISLLGSGSAILSPHGAIKVLAAGSGRVSLLTKPSSIKRSMVGSAEIIESSGTPPARPSASALMVAPASIPPGTDIVRGDRVMIDDDQNVDLGHVDRRKLAVTVAASGSIKAEGRVDELTVHAMASGQVQFGRLMVRKAVVELAGSGDVTIAPSQEAQITILGSGNVHLTTSPAKITRTIVGSGRIITDGK